MTNQISYDPRPVKYQNRKEHRASFKNVCLNYSFALPICQMYEPVNLYVVAHEHDYLKYSLVEMFLQNMNISTVTESGIHKIEAAIRGQYKNPHWTCERLCRITGSNFGRICRSTSKIDMDKIARQMVQNLDIKSKSIVHGRLYEKVAVQRYSTQKSLVIMLLTMDWLFAKTTHSLQYHLKALLLIIWFLRQCVFIHLTSGNTDWRR